MQYPWTVIYVASRQEKVVAQRLAQLNITHYLPLVNRVRIWADRRKTVEMPLFNGYIFVSPDERQHAAVLQIPGVVNFIRFNGKPAIVRNDEIQMIRKLVTHGYDIEAMGLSPETPPGTKVKVVQGIFLGLTGELLETGNGQQLLIVLEGIRQGIRVKLPPEALERI
jgi:transcriptional antiterminator NusG